MKAKDKRNRVASIKKNSFCYLTEEQSHAIKSNMFSRKIRVQDLCDLLGGSRAYWTSMLLGQTEMHVTHIIKLSKLLGLSKQEILDYFFNFAFAVDVTTIPSPVALGQGKT